MWECKYGTEPADLKLLAIRFSKKIWMVLVAALIGAVTCGTAYFLIHVVLAPEPEYVANSMLYVDFVQGEGEAPKYYTFNTAGWSGFVKTDEILDKAMSYMSDEIQQADYLKTDEKAAMISTPIDKEEMRASVDANVDADYRVIDLLVTNTNPDRAVVIAHSVEKAFEDFAGEMREIEKIRVMTSAVTAKQILVDTATYRAVIWGAILAAVFVLFVMLIHVILDDSIYVPITFERRYGIPMLGNDLEEIKRNTALLCANGEKVTHITIGKGLIGNAELAHVKPGDSVILDIAAGAHNGKIIEHAISQLQKLDCRIVAAMLINADEKLLKAYYFYENFYEKYNEKWKKNG